MERGYLRLALTLASIHFGQHLLSLVDTLMLGWAGEDQLAGSSLGTSAMFVVGVVGVGLVMALDTLVSQSVGAGAHVRARGWLLQGERVAWIAGITLSLLVLGLPWLLGRFDYSEEILETTAAYIHGRAPGLVPFLLLTAHRSYLQAYQRVRPVVISIVVANVINVPLDALLIFGDDALAYVNLPRIGLPALGAFGAGLASTIVTVASAMVTAAGARSLAPELQRSTAECPWSKLLRLGAPLALQLLAEVGAFSSVAFFAGILGTGAAAAHQIAISLASLSFSFAVGAASATSVAVGHAIGEGEIARAHRLGRAGIWLGAAMMTVPSAIFMAAPELVASAFTDNMLVLETAAGLIVIVGVFQLGDGLQAAAAGALRGIGANTSAFVANLFGHYAVGLSLGTYLAFSRGLGIDGLWWGLCAGLFSTAMLLIVRFDQLLRKHSDEAGR